MASSFTKSKALRSTRSISLPPRSHPTTQKIEEELNKLRAWEISASESQDAETICNGLVGLSDLQKCVDDLLQIPQTIQALTKSHHDEKWTDELLEKSVKILDICGTTREIVSQFKESVWDLKSFLRRRMIKDTNICRFNTLRKKMKHDVKRLITNLKKMDQEIWNSVPLDVDHHVSAVIRALRESTSMNNFILQKVLTFLSLVMVSKPKTSKWSLVSRLVHKGAIATSQEQEHNNTNNKIDVVLCGLGKFGSSETLDRLGTEFECIEKGLESSFRSLIRSRSSLLNVISCQ